MANLSDTISTFVSTLGATLKSMAKIALAMRHANPSGRATDKRLIILGNGPSLRRNIDEDMQILTSTDCMAVNFAANAPEFALLKPRYYLMADPHFFSRPITDPNVESLIKNISAADWDMTLLLPAGCKLEIDRPNITTEHFNPTGVEGFEWFAHRAYRAGLGMPRPRNVLIPAIMAGIALGYKQINLLGADHSWLTTLSVDNDNTVVTVQPHFYKDNNEEKQRVKSVYADVRLHDILLSFHLAFKSYHAIARYAARRGVEIINSTDNSFIDAFKRNPL